MRKSVYVVSHSRHRAINWARKHDVLLDMELIQSWEQLAGLEGFNKVLHVIPLSYNLKSYSYILDFAKGHRWTIKHVEG